MNKLSMRLLRRISHLDVNLKKNYKIYRKVTEALSFKVATTDTILDFKIYEANREIPVRFYIPEKMVSEDVILFFHGGGWVIGSIDSYANICALMANTLGIRVLSVDYRLAPEYPYPAGLNDCYTVTQKLFAMADKLRIKKEKIVLVGDSAGGNLSAAVSLMARDKKAIVPSKQILIYPATYYDHSEKSPFKSLHKNGSDYFLTSKKIQDYMLLYAPDIKDRKSSYVAPFLEKDLSGQPDTLIITAELDPLRDEGEAFGKRLKDAGNQVSVYRINGEIHGFWSSLLRRRATDEVFRLMNEFIKAKNEI